MEKIKKILKLVQQTNELVEFIPKWVTNEIFEAEINIYPSPMLRVEITLIFGDLREFIYNIELADYNYIVSSSFRVFGGVSGTRRTFKSFKPVLAFIKKNFVSGNIRTVKKEHLEVFSILENNLEVN